LWQSREKEMARARESTAIKAGKSHKLYIANH